MKDGEDMQEGIHEIGKDSGAGIGFLRRQIFLMWWQAAKPAYFTATLVPLALAFVAAGKYYGMWEGLVFSGALLVAFSLHLSVNLCYHLFGTDGNAPSRNPGPQLKEVFTTKAILQIVGGLYAFALLLTFLGVWITGLNVLLLFVLFAMLSSFFYVAPPVRLSHQGMGEVLVFLNLGVVTVSGTFFALTRVFPLQALALAIPVGAMVAMVIFYQNIANLEEDTAAYRKTLATLLGAEKAVFFFQMTWPGIWLLMIMLWFCGLCSWQILLGIALASPFYLKLASDLNQLDNPDFSHGISRNFTYLMYLICGISLIVAVAYTAPVKSDAEMRTPSGIRIERIP